MANYNTLKNAAILNPTTATDLGSDANRFSNVYMSGNIVMSNGVTVTSTNVITPKIASISYIGDDTATSTAGGQVVTLNGSGFSTGAIVLIGSALASSTTVVSNTQITFIPPATSAGTYVLYVVNPDGGTATFITGISFSGTPTWSTNAGSLGSLSAGASVNITVAATGDAPVTYTVKAGTSLPTGLSLNSTTGFISGTMPAGSGGTTYNFTLTAIDAQHQDTDRAFSIITAAAPSNADYLVVAGGGGGGGYGGGGGAGGLLTSSGISFSFGVTYTITVGLGGVCAGISDAQITGTQGGNSSIAGSGFTTVQAIGGGGGQGFGKTFVAYQNGGSGGGSAPDFADIGKGVYPGSTYLSQPRQGYDGGIYDGTGGQNDRMGNGGGAGAAGSSGSPTGTGGIGLQNSITGTATYYAGGGGGGGYTGNQQGGLGGGGNGGTHTVAPYTGTSGTVNTGGGGGGGSYTGGNFATGGAGGSGVVIIRYTDSFSAAASTTGSPTVTVTGGYRVYKFTDSGSITF